MILNVRLGFSVICCVYEKDIPSYLKDAIDSVLWQTKLPDELIFVIDGPIPAALFDVIENCTYLLQKIGIAVKRVPLEVNVGHGRARQIGVDNCSNEIFAIIDADDINLEDRFRISYNFLLEHNDVAIVGGDILEIDAVSEEIVSEKRMIKGLVGRKYITRRCPLNQMTIMARRDAIIDAGNYQHFHFNEDYYLWIRLFASNYRMYNIGIPFVKARVDRNFYRRRGGIKYFTSEVKIQCLMYRLCLLNKITFLKNCILRLFVQVLIPESIRGFVYKLFLRGIIR